MMVPLHLPNSENTQVRVLIPVTVFDRWLTETGQRPRPGALHWTPNPCWGRRRLGWFPRRRCPIQRGRRDGVHRRARWTAQPGEHAMSSRAQHYREAERLSESEDPTWANTPTPWSPRPRSAPPWPPSATTPTTSTWTCAPWRRRAKRWPGRRRRRAV